MARKAARIREGTLVTKDVYEDAIAPFTVQALNRLIENMLVIHARQQPRLIPAPLTCRGL